jgi:transcriptional regulator with XRE-family HTH domain
MTKKEDLPQYSKRIVALRERLELSQKDLGALAGVTAPAITMWETGKRFPRGKNLRRLAEALQVSESDLLDPNGPIIPPPAADPVMKELRAIRASLDKKNGPSMDPKKRELFDLIASLSPADVEIFIGMIKRRLGRKSDDIREP